MFSGTSIWGRVRRGDVRQATIILDSQKAWNLASKEMKNPKEAFLDQLQRIFFSTQSKATCVFLE